MAKNSLQFFLYAVALLVYLTSCARTQAELESAPPPGFSRFASDQVEIWLPADFQQIDAQYDPEAFRQFMLTKDPFSPEYLKGPDHPKGVVPRLELAAIRDSSQSPYSAVAEILALYHPIPPVPPPTPREVIQGLMQGSAGSTSYSSYKELTLQAGEAARFTNRFFIGADPISCEVYALSSAGSLWLITFCNDAEIFDSEVRDFRAAIATFRVIGRPALTDYYHHNTQVFLCCGSLLLIFVVIVIAMKVRSSW